MTAAVARNTTTPPQAWKTAYQILIEAAARAEAAGDIVAAYRLRREAEQAQLARLRSVQ